MKLLLIPKIQLTGIKGTEVNRVEAQTEARLLTFFHHHVIEVFSPFVELNKRIDYGPGLGPIHYIGRYGSNVIK